jgi:hypothetical protein
MRSCITIRPEASSLTRLQLFLPKSIPRGCMFMLRCLSDCPAKRATSKRSGLSIRRAEVSLNLTDNREPGTKRRLVADARGMALGLTSSGTNRLCCLTTR